MDMLSENACQAFIVILVVLAIGWKAVENHPRTRVWGQSLALLAFLTALASAWLSEKPGSATEWFPSVIGSAILAALTLGISWTALVVLSFFAHITIFQPISTLRQWMAAMRTKIRAGQERLQERVSERERRE